MKQLINRQTISGETAFEFDRECGSFFVKNFSSAPVYVSFESGTDEDDCIKLPSMYAQECTINTLQVPTIHTATNKIYVTGTGEVEVQAMSWLYDYSQDK